MNKQLEIIDLDFNVGFSAVWGGVTDALTASGVKLGAIVQNKDGRRFKLTRIEPTIYLFGDSPTARVTIYGVQFLKGDKWGTHEHWAGFLSDFRVVPTPGLADRAWG